MVKGSLIRALTLLALALALGLLAGCGGDDDDGSAGGTTTTETTEDTAAEGRAAFDSADCAQCHTFADAGASGTVGPNLDESDVSEEEAEEQVRNGGGAMPSFEGTLSDAEIEAVAEYVVENRA